MCAAAAAAAETRCTSTGTKQRVVVQARTQLREPLTQFFSSSMCMPQLSLHRARQSAGCAKASTCGRLPLRRSTLRSSAPRSFTLLQRLRAGPAILALCLALLLPAPAAALHLKRNRLASAPADPVGGRSVGRDLQERNDNVVSPWAYQRIPTGNEAHLASNWRLAYPGSVKCTGSCAHPRSATIAPCPRQGSCNSTTLVRDAVSCVEGHTGAVCGSCESGWAAASPCGACQPCQFHDSFGKASPAIALLVEYIFPLLVAFGVVQVYVAAPRKLSSHLALGALRILHWFVFMWLSADALSGATTFSLSFSAHTTAQWVATCGLRPAWRQEEVPGSLYPISPPQEPVDFSVLGIVFGLLRVAGAAAPPAATCMYGGGVRGLPSSAEATTAVGVILGILIFLVVILVGSAPGQAPVQHKHLLQFGTLMPAALFLVLLPGSLRASAKASGLWADTAAVDTVHTPAYQQPNFLVFEIIFGMLAFSGTVGMWAMVSWPNWVDQPGTLAYHPSVRGCCTAGFRRQLTVQQALEQMQSASTAPQAMLSSLALQDAHADEGMWYGQAPLFLPTTYGAMQIVSMVTASAMLFYTTDPLARFFVMTACLCCSFALLCTRQPWAVSDLDTLDGWAHLAVALQLLSSTARSLGSEGALAAALAGEVFHTISLAVSFFVWTACLWHTLRGCLAAWRAALAKAFTSVYAAVPELGIPPLEGGDDIAQLQMTRFPDFSGVLATLAARCCPACRKYIRTSHTPLATAHTLLQATTTDSAAQATLSLVMGVHRIRRSVVRDGTRTWRCRGVPCCRVSSPDGSAFDAPPPGEGSGTRGALHSHGTGAELAGHGRVAAAACEAVEAPLGPAGGRPLRSADLPPVSGVSRLQAPEGKRGWRQAASLDAQEGAGRPLPQAAGARGDGQLESGQAMTRPGSVADSPPSHGHGKPGAMPEGEAVDTYSYSAMQTHQPHCSTPNHPPY